ncbi:LppP/LprE family lipoprotein [Curtobacterium flaccumfaciens]|uniref:LppP/LprE family lipoprotein n=1 Tax=Curtobacterium flaccumfaciens TaxID=2035 RepID=UPI001BDEA5F6|nr:LppP/LprE family lipoprotein [Curtobacterium flaccumfaciens]MBT1597821.1 LppP/LprE family lipoprotein [Curtobacterium flaccumfaciens pv. flaccumfaciens]
MRLTRTALILTTATLAALLTGCSGADGADGSAATPTVTETVTAPPTVAASTPTPTPTPTCGPTSGAEAAAAGIAALPLPAGLEDAKWDAANADYSGYDACAPLSWSVVEPEFATAGSPYAILLFHEGRYLGTATAEQYAFEPTIERRSESAVTVTYKFAKAGEPNAAPSGRTTATFTWNDETGRVDMTGDTPPAQ